MKPVAKLKEEARQFEAREAWAKAIEIYQGILGAEDGEPDLSLMNRIGDLHVRLGRTEDAVRWYLKAADKYAEAGLLNNAIALCNKGLRYQPGLADLLLRLSRYSTSQGFFTDARRYLLDFAENRLREGALADAFSALEAYARDVGDPEVRELLADRLVAHGRTGDAVPHLLEAYTARLAAGQTVEAEAVRARILELDPRAIPLQSPGDGTEADLEADLDVFPRDDHAHGFAEDAVDGLVLQAVATTSGAMAAPTDSLLEIDAATEDPAEIDALGGIDHDPGDLISTGDSLPSLLDEEIGLPSLGSHDTGSLLDEGSPWFDDEPSHFDDDLPGPVDEDAGFDDDLPRLFEPEDDPAIGPEDLPLLETADEWPPSFDVSTPAADGPEDDGFGDLDVEPAWLDGVAPGDIDHGSPVAFADDAEALVEDGPPELDGEPADGGVHAMLERVEDLLVDGFHGDVVRALRPLEDAPLDAGSLGRVVLILDILIEQHRDDLAAHQLRLAFGMRFDGGAGVVAHLFGLAECLERIGSVAKASAVYHQILELDPGNVAATKALATAPPRPIVAADVTPTPAPPSSPSPATPSVPAPPGREGFVDLASLVRLDEEERSTRFNVPHTPSGDEDADLADLLSQFRTRVNEDLRSEDPGSHYDLGLAFREMGLLDEAIGEFQTALRGGEERRKIYEELGKCFIEKGQHNLAAKILERALRLPEAGDVELLGIYFSLGQCYEALGRGAEAREVFEHVVSIDKDFADVTQRLARL